MAWPVDDLTTTHLDAATDDPSQARVELKACIDKLKLILAEIPDGATVWHSSNDGAGSTLDADYVDGWQLSDILSLANATGSLAASKISDGVGSTLDADLLDGQQGVYYLSLANATGTVDNTQIAANAVKQGHLHISTAVTAGLTSDTTITPTGGLYHLGWEGYENSGTGQCRVCYGQGGVGSYTSSYTTLLNFFDISGNVDMRGSYITASPPYKLGNTDIPYFAYLLLNSNNEFKLGQLALDPTWAYNGPHQCAATSYENQNNKIVPYINKIPIPRDLEKLKKKDPATFFQERRRIKAKKVKLTPELKNKNMPFAPHPFRAIAPTDKVVVIAPDDQIMNFLIDSHDDNEVRIQDLLNTGYLKIKDEVNLSVTPPGVSICRAVFK